MLRGQRQISDPELRSLLAEAESVITGDPQSRDQQALKGGTYEKQRKRLDAVVEKRINTYGAGFRDGGLAGEPPGGH